MKAVWEFSQGEHLPPDNQGVCMQLVAYWVSMMRSDKAEMNASSKKVEVLCKQEARKLQRAYEKAGDDASITNDEAVTWALRGLKLSKDGYTNCANAGAIVDYLDEKRQGYSMGIFFKGGGGHALGIWRSGRSSGFLSGLSGHSYFFDPNAGCYKGNTSSLRGWLTGFLSKTYPNINGMNIAKVEELTARAHWGGAFRMV